MLSNTLYQLNIKRSLRIAYFGGSITEGGGENGWRRLTTKWFQSRWENAEITEINAAIGGTGTDLGVFRCEKDVLAFAPDLTFIEFAVNDSTYPAEQLARTTEAIVRKLRLSNPAMDIAFAFTQTKYIADNLTQGIPFYSRDIHAAIAAHYHLPTIDMGTPLARAAASAENGWLTYTKDNVHPITAGYAIMEAIMLEELDKLLSGEVPAASTAYLLPSPLYDSLPIAACLIEALPLAGNYIQPDPSAEYDWSRLHMTLCNRYPTVIGANKPGAEITFRFDGTTVGLYFMMASDSGSLDYRIDNGEWKRLSTWDEYCLRFDRAQFHLLTDKLSSGSHTLTLRVSQQKHPDSDGHWIRIGAFGVC